MSVTDSSIPTAAPRKISLLHERLELGPYWLTRILESHNADTITEAEAADLRAQIHEYAQGASDNPAVRPLLDMLESTLLQQLDDWSRRVTRLRYQTFLDSQGWDRTRLKVMERAGYVCEGCRERRATQIHHKHYEQPWGEEMLFDLVALCPDCHERIHAKEKAS